MIYEQWYTGRWVPVTESLPNDGEDVLVCYPYGLVMIDRFYLCPDGSWFFEFDGDEEVIAWTPLPAPYKEPSDGDQ